MGREYLVVWAGRHQRNQWEEICDRWRQRISRVTPVRELVVKAKGGAGGDEAQRRAAEGEAILAALPDPCWLIALDSRGKTLSSERFAAELARLRDEFPHPVAFAIGSDLGLDRAVVKAARRVLAFGPMTLSHELARAVLYEQLYRASSIHAGTGYHRSD